MKRIYRKMPLMAFALGLGLIVATSSFKYLNGTVDPVTYHITGEDEEGNYIVTTGGRCDDGLDDCQFSTTLTPDVDNKISKAALAAQVPSVEIEKGVYVAQ